MYISNDFLEYLGVYKARNVRNGFNPLLKKPKREKLKEKTEGRE
jgi:hypothetical protein